MATYDWSRYCTGSGSKERMTRVRSRLCFGVDGGDDFCSVVKIINTLHQISYHT